MTQRSSTLLPWLITGLSVLAMCALGYWQLERMIYKQQRLASIAQKSANESLSLNEALSQQDPRDVAVVFEGVPNALNMLMLDNQIHNGQVGFDILAPVKTNLGWILVNYGWVKAPNLSRSLPSVELDSGLQRFTGVITRPEKNPLVQETNTAQFSYPALIQEINVEMLSKQFGHGLSTYVIQLTTEDPAFIREYQPVVMPPEKHLGYAVQWFGLAIAAAAIGGFAISKKGRSNA